MAKTFDTSRVGGGTYELEQDASGNYKLKSVGFAQVNKLNLPDLATSDTTTTPPKKEEEKKTEVADPFKKLASQNIGGDNNRDLEISQNYERINPKDISVKQAGDRQALDPRDDRSPQEIQNLKDAQGTYNQMQSYINEAKGDIGIGVSQGIYDLRDKANETIMSAKEKYATETQYNTPKTTGLQAVKSNFQKVKGKANQIVKGSATVALLSGAGKVFKGIEDALLGPDQVELNTANKKALNVLGYKTNAQLGLSTDPGRIAGNPADNVFAGMNAQSMRGNVFNGARKRISKRQETSKKLTGEKKERFDKKTQEFKDQVEKAQGEKNKQDIAKGPGALGPAGGGGNGGGSGGRVICTELHSTGEMSTVDWVRDTRFTFKTLTKSHVKGYLFWAIPTVRHIKKYPLYRKIWKHIAQHRANDIAWRLGESKFDLLGRIYAGIGEPTCWLIGKFVSDKQYNELNLKNWRKA